IITDNYDELEVNADEAERIRRELAYVYPYSHEAGRKSKYSVSELKHDSMLERYDRKQNEAEVPYFLKEEKEPYVPMFVRRKEESAKSDKKYGISQGALRGTAVHRVMECLDFHRVYEAGKASGDNGMGGRITAEAAHELARQEILRMQAEGLLSDEYAGLVPVPMIAAFLQDPIALRMAYADARGELFCEKPFGMENDGELIQGIVDAFLMEGERIVLLDYKTDAVKAGEELLARYKTQLMLYAEVLMRLFGKDGMGMECMMYSFRLKEIVVC
ncbi:MAG: PD-(D/E)XK nuclease family protein, partial [Clostridiales bacterium]|nr:PD-(D/E)XK nuclease family protein [Clostridiales bacterium]